MADQHHRVAVAREANGFEVNLGHKRAGGVDNAQSLAFGQLDHLRGDAVCAEDADRTVRDLVDSIEEIPDGSVCVFSAHGVSPQVVELAESKRLRVIDATCPLVTKVHLEAIRFSRDGYSMVLIGHPGHEEVEGTMGEAPMQLVSSVKDVEQLELDRKSTR